MKINDKVDFSDTMNLPRKTITTNADLTKKESFFLARVQDVRRYRDVLNKNKLSNTVYNILENPMIIKDEVEPTYVQNKILKDMVIRYRLLSGFKVNHNIDFIHIDDMLENQKEKTPKLQDLINKRATRRKELTETAKKQIQQIKDLGTIINYSNFNSSTLNSEFESKTIDKFWQLYKDKKIYHDLRPVNWCPKCKRALENDNIKREEESVKNYFFNFKIRYDKDVFKEFNNLENTYIVASTIRPWTLDFENALAVVEDVEYSLIEVIEKGKPIHYVIASDYVPYIMDLAFFLKFDVKKKIKGSELVGMTCENVIENTPTLAVIPTKKEYVILDNKNTTGIGVISSGNTYVDYLVSKENVAVKLSNNLTKEGKSTMLASNYKSTYYKEINEKVIEFVAKNNLLLCTDMIKIKMPKCKECNDDVIYRSEQEWYIKKSDDDQKLKGNFDELLSKLNHCRDSKKSNIKEKLYESIKEKEKLISNESAFGTPIPVFYCAECSSEVINDQVLSILKKLFKEKGIESWYKETPEEILQGQVICEKCGCSFLFKGTTTLNEFFKYLCVPLVNESSEHIEGQEEINICIENEDAFIRKIKTLSFDDYSLNDLKKINKIMLHPKIKISSGGIKEKENSAVKEEVKKEGLFKKKKEKIEKNTDKSKDIEKNVFNMRSVVEKYGTDVLRLWCVQKGPEEVATLSESNILYIDKIYKQIRRTLKFLLSNLYDFNPTKDMINVEERDDLDKYMYVKLLGMKKDVEQNYDDLDLYKVYLNVLKYCNETLCDEYFNVIKYRLYVLNPTDKKRKSTQSTLYEIFMTLMTFIEPIIPFTFEETWSYIWHTNSDERDNLLLYRNKLKDVSVNEFEREVKKWNNIFFVVNKVNKMISKNVLEKKIKNTFEAKVTLEVNENTKAFIDNNHEDFLRALNVSVLDTKVSDSSHIIIEKAEGVPCKRCLNYSLHIGEDLKYRHLCPTCAKILNEREKL